MSNNSHLLHLIIVLIIIGLSACCSINNICDCFDENDDTIGLKFNLDSINGGFNHQETDSAILIKFQKNDFTKPIDTTLFTYNNNDNYYGSIALGGTYDSFEDFDYMFIDKTGKYIYKITEITIAGKSTGGCCNCYTNTVKKAKMNGTEYNLFGTDNYISLNK